MVNTGSIPPEASRVVLTPIDTSQFRFLGLRIVQEEIHSMRDEKKDLCERVLNQGEDVTVYYKIDRVKAEVVYRVSSLEPSHAYIGRKTTVIIQGESHVNDTLAEFALTLYKGLFKFDIGLQLNLVNDRKEPGTKSLSDVVEEDSKKDENTFRIEVKGNIGDLLRKVSNDASGYGITFQGDAGGGSFEGSGIGGKYYVHGKKITIHVDRKPPFITIDFIKERIGEYFHGNK